MRHLLVTGFGPFLDVRENPSGILALAVHGTVLECRLGPVQLCGKVLPVQYDTAAAETLLAARQVDAIGILGIGVARGALAPRVERTGRSRCDGVTPDAAGQVRSRLGDIPELQSAHSEALSLALGVALSDDAGPYVCNAWLYGVLAGATIPAAFLHITSGGMEGAVLKAGLVGWIDGFWTE